MKICSIVGARPQFIKLAPLAGRLADTHDHLVVHTGQHYDYEMSKAFFDDLDIPKPDIDLAVGSGSHGHQTGHILVALDAVLAEWRPDVVLVYGDTNSTLAGALAAVKMHIPVAHVEAGYRSFDLSMPEEVNRLVTDRVCQLHLAPTRDAVENLAAEGCEADGVVLVGNIMAEALLNARDHIARSTILQTMDLKPLEYAVVTIHRPENTDRAERLAGILKGLRSLEIPVVLPVHPRLKKLVEKKEFRACWEGLNLLEVPPLRYADFARLLSEARLALTDSGGVQEEAILQGVPCLTLRDNTERVATVRAGANVLVGARASRIAHGIADWMAKPARPGFEVPRLWDGGVSARIVAALERHAGRMRILPADYC